MQALAGVRKNAPTESNIRTALTAVLSSLGYSCYSELPFQTREGNIRVDFAVIRDLTGVRDVPEKGKGTTILAEMKTDGSGDANMRAWVQDFTSIYPLSLDLSEDRRWVETKSMDRVILSFFWTDNKKKRKDIRDCVSTEHESKPVRKEVIGQSLENVDDVFIFHNLIRWDL